MKRQTVLSVPLFCAVLYLAAKDFSLLVNVIRGSIPLYSPCRQSSSINVTQVKKLASAKYSERLATLARFCDQYSWSDHLLGRWTNQAPFWKDKLWFSYQHRLAYCHMPKVGSSTWYAHLLTLAGEEAKREASLYETETDPYKVRTHIRRTFYYSPEDMNLQRAIDKDLLAFVFVRHPFSRLVSGYNEKMKTMWKTIPEMKEIRDHVLIKFRGLNRTDPAFATAIPAPQEFSDYLVEEAALRGPETLNGHFRPQWTLCPFCLIDFDVLGKIEDFEEDSAYVMEALKVRAQLDPDLHERRSRKLDQFRTDEEFFSRVSKATVWRLQQLYQMDFEAFGYDAREFYQMAKTN